MNQILFMKHRAKKAHVNNRTYAPLFRPRASLAGILRTILSVEDLRKARTFTPPFSDEFFICLLYRIYPEILNEFYIHRRFLDISRLFR